MEHSSFYQNLTFFQKIKNYDFILLFCILLIGIISSFTMYSTDGGEILFHTQSHIFKFLFFFPMMIILSFIDIKVWHYLAYLFYIIILAVIKIRTYLVLMAFMENLLLQVFLQNRIVYNPPKVLDLTIMLN